MSDERVRLFVALELPSEVREALAQWRQDAGDTQGLRFVAAESLHVTLCFLGWQDAGDVGPIEAALPEAVAGRAAVPLSLEQALWLPSRRPRVLAVSLAGDGEGLSSTQAAVSAALVAGGWYTAEKRPFLPHVTVARVGAGGPGPGTRAGPGARARPDPGARARPDPGARAHAVPRARARPDPIPNPPAIAFSGSRITLYRSRLGRGGSRYEALQTLELPE